jgi:hypothetical protein
MITTINGDYYVIPSSPDWSPIGTAPRNGELVDLWHVAGFRMTDLWWDEEEGSWAGHEDREFTHWRFVTCPADQPDQHSIETPRTVKVGDHQPETYRGPW